MANGTPNGKIVTKVGNLTEDPTLRFGKSGTPFATFSIAVESPIKAGDWSGPKETTYYRVVCFKTLAENVAESLEKGHRVVVVGKAETEEFTRKDGTPGTAKKIVADHVGAELRFATADIARVTRRSSARVEEPELEPF